MTPAEIVAEFRKKYEGTYVFVQMPDSKEQNLFHMSSVAAGGDGHGTMVLASEEFGKIQLNMGTAHQIKFAFPKCLTFQHGTEAYMFYREPRRQWQRGLSSGNCRIVNVAAELDQGRIRESERLDFNLVAAAFASKIYSYAKALGMLKSGKYRSVALEDAFSLVLSPTRAYQYLLMYRTSPLAGVDKDGALVVLLEPSFEMHIKKVVTQNA